MDYYFDLFVLYHDEKEEQVVGRMLSHTELMVLVNHLLYERKRHFESGKPTSHYADYIRIE